MTHLKHDRRRFHRWQRIQIIVKEVCSASNVCRQHSSHKVKGPILAISFSQEEDEDIFPYEDDLIVINLQLHYWNVKKVLIDPNSSKDILYWEAFQDLKLDLELLQPFKGSLVAFSDKHVQLLGYVTIKTTFGTDRSAKMIKVKYMVINTSLPYNICGTICLQV